MLMYLGDIDSLNGSTNFAVIHHSLLTVSDPLILSFLPDANGNIDTASNSVINLMYSIDACQRGVYMYVRTDAPINSQIDNIYNIFHSYGLDRFLNGIAIKTPTGSYTLSRAIVNGILDYAHNTYSIGVAFVCNTVDDIYSIFEPPAPRGPSDDTLIQATADLNVNIPYKDWIVHLNPLSAVLPVTDLSSIMSVLQLTKNTTYAQAVVQTMNVNVGAFDNALNVSLDAPSLTILQNVATFFEALTWNYTLLANVSDGSNNIHLFERDYRPLSALSVAPVDYTLNPLGVQGTYIESDGTNIYVRNSVNGVVNLAVFDYNLNLSNNQSLTRLF